MDNKSLEDVVGSVLTEQARWKREYSDRLKKIDSGDIPSPRTGDILNNMRTNGYVETDDGDIAKTRNSDYVLVDYDFDKYGPHCMEAAFNTVMERIGDLLGQAAAANLLRKFSDKYGVIVKNIDRVFADYVTNKPNLPE